MRLTFTIFFSLIIFHSYSQFGGSATYNYLNLPASARIASLGGTNISTYSDDINFAYYNPALLNQDMDGNISISHAIMTGNINHGYAAYGKHIDKWNATVHGGILYESFGQMQLIDEAGTQVGNFSAGEYALTGGIGYHENKLSYGGNVKLLYSQLESYKSFGAAIDLGGAFIDTSSQFSAGIVIKNIGTQFKSYTAGNKEEIPFEIQLGVSKRLKHLPLRFSLTAHNLQTFDIRYDDPAAVDDINIFSSDSTEVVVKKYTADNILRHLIIAGEFYFGKNFDFRIGYDHLNRKELSLDSKRGLTGFSFGAGIKIRKYQIDFAHEFYSVAGGSNQITIAANLNAFMKR